MSPAAVEMTEWASLAFGLLGALAWGIAFLPWLSMARVREWWHRRRLLRMWDGRVKAMSPTMKEALNHMAGLPADDPDRLVIEPKLETFESSVHKWHQENWRIVWEQMRWTFICEPLPRECAAARQAGRN